jgi:hypothetical protein
MKRVITAITAALLLAIIPIRAQAPTMSFTFTGLYACTVQPQFSNYICYFFDSAGGEDNFNVTLNPDGTFTNGRITFDVLQPDHSYLPYVANWAGTWIGQTGPPSLGNVFTGTFTGNSSVEVKGAPFTGQSTVKLGPGQGRKLRYFTTVTGGSGSLTNGVE